MQLLLSAGLNYRSNRSCIRLLSTLSDHILRNGLLDPPSSAGGPSNAPVSCKQGNELSSLPFNAACSLSS